ncbi:MAG: GumC family protein [Paludibacter sp.]
MNIIKFIKILIQKIKYIIILPILVGGIVFFLTKDLPVSYESEATIFTGITSNSGLEVIATKVDNNATLNEYNNVLTIFKSDLLFQEISLHLLTQHLMLKKPKSDIISEEAFNKLKENTPDKIKKLIVSGNFEKSYANLTRFIQQDEKNYIYHLINYGNPYYSIGSISRLKVERLNGSDMIKLTYESDDPGISYNTVKFAAEIFIKKYSLLKSNQSSSAVEYFEKQLKEISLKLDDAENRLLAFNTDNTIINYYEQTEQVTTQQEKIEIRLQEVKMECEAAEAVLKKIEKEVELRLKINLRNKEVIGIREQLVNYNLQITRAEIDDKIEKSIISDLKSKRFLIEKKLENKIDSINLFTNKSEGIESQKILGEWLDAVKNYESSSAELKSMKLRQIEFMKQFMKYAPLGATIKRIEREIDVDEREYLNILNQLGLAKQRQQNTDMVSNMKVLDEPKFPINAIPSKKKLYVIIAVLFTMIFYILGLFIVELLDSRIKTPSLLKKLSGIDVLAAFCTYANKKFINTEKITEKAAMFIFEKIKYLSANSDKPYVIQVLSNWDGAGKEYASGIINSEIQKHGLTTYLLANSEAQKQSDGAIPAENETNKEVVKNVVLLYNSYSELIAAENITANYVISVIPSISNGIENSLILKTADLNLIVFDANSTWVEADNFNLNKLKQLNLNNLYTILTKSDPDNLEEMYGEIPKKRSFIRVLIKKNLKRVT